MASVVIGATWQLDCRRVERAITSRQAIVQFGWCIGPNSAISASPSVLDTPDPAVLAVLEVVISEAVEWSVNTGHTMMGSEL